MYFTSMCKEHEEMDRGYYEDLLSIHTGLGDYDVALSIAKANKIPRTIKSLAWRRTLEHTFDSKKRAELKEMVRMEELRESTQDQPKT